MDHTLLYTLGASLLIILASLAGVLFAWKVLRGFMERNLPYLATMSAGIFSVVVLHLIEESFEILGSVEEIILYIGIGSLVMYLITKIFPEAHHHEPENCHEEHSRSGAKRMLIGDSIHNIADGIFIAPAFAISPLLGITTTLGILAHEVVQEIGEFFIYKKAGYSNARALGLNALSASTILIGAMIGLYISNVESILGILLALSAGVFLYIVLADMIPSSYKSALQKKRHAHHIVAFALGLVLMTAISLH